MILLCQSPEPSPASITKKLPDSLSANRVLEAVNGQNYNRVTFRKWRSTTPRVLREYMIQFWRVFKEIKFVEDFQGEHSLIAGKYPVYTDENKRHDWEALKNSMGTTQEEIVS